MFQSFDEIDDPARGRPHVALLRNELARCQLDGFLIPHSDEYMNEQILPCSQRLQWLTGFSGSAGLSIVLKDKAAIFVDGRYTLQAIRQVDASIFEIVHSFDESPNTWLSRNMMMAQQIGFDPKLHSIDEANRLRSVCKKINSHLVPCNKNLIDIIWTNQPPISAGPVKLHPLALSGCTADHKIRQLMKEMAEAHTDVLIITQPDSIAWLLNIRGTDVKNTPVPMCYLIVHRTNGLSLFIDNGKIDKSVHKKLYTITALCKPAHLQQDLHKLSNHDITIQLDPHKSNDWFRAQLEGGKAHLQYASDPIKRMQAQKNDVEISGARNAHLRDGIAMTQFLAWLDANASSGTISEIDAAKKLESFRIKTGVLYDLAFDTIAASGPHAALPHYRVNQTSNRKIGKNEIFLIDSGAQYQDGTTDVTRTLIIGRPSDEMRDRFTRVLKGHIAVATSCFPQNVNGAQIDAFARRALWEAGLDFDHGTGHGVGSFLAVHDGFVSLSKNSTTPLRAGMILSNEPGYYKPGAYGIRIENIMLVRHLPDVPNGELPLLHFETMTLVPIDKQLILRELMNTQEVQWLNTYHATVKKALEAHLDSDTQNWLKQATAPIE